MKIRIYILSLIIFSHITFACTIFDTKNSIDETLIGRNFDWSKDNGQINFIPANKNNNGFLTVSLDNPYMPYEGMNDKGLFIAISAVPNTETTVNIFKPIRKSLEIIKVVLEKSSNLDEAIKQFKKYSIAFGQFLGNPLVHFKIVQKDGQSIIIEFVNNKMVVIKDKSKIMTNHYISNIKIKSDSKTSHKRYKIISNYQNKTNTIKSIFEALNKAKDTDTVWSNVYNLANQEIYIKYKNNKIVKFNLKDELYSNNRSYFYDMKNFNNKNIISNETSIIQIRPHFGYGNDDTKHYGLRVLLNSNENQTYGLELTKFENDNDKFQAIGIVLEQRLWDWFNMSIGTVGYFNYGVNDENIIGLMTNLGWEPNNSIPFKPFITYRNDTIFTKKTKILHSISLGFKFEF